MDIKNSLFENRYNAPDIECVVLDSCASFLEESGGKAGDDIDFGDETW